MHSEFGQLLSYFGEAAEVLIALHILKKIIAIYRSISTSLVLFFINCSSDLQPKHFSKGAKTFLWRQTMPSLRMKRAPKNTA